MNIDITWTWSYAFTESDEWKNQVTREKCFDCSQKEHLHKDCLTNSFYKLWSMILINSRENQSDTQNKKTYAASVINTVISQSWSRIQVLSFYESENDSFWNQVAS